MEYERGLRVMLPFWSVLLVGAVVGVVKDNPRISLVAMLLILFLVYPVMLSNLVNPLYMRNYSSVSRFVKTHIRHAVVNTLVVWLPFALMLCLGYPLLIGLSLSVQFYLATFLLVVQVCFLRILCRNNMVMEGLILLALCLLAGLVAYSAWGIVVQFLIACLLFQFSLSSLKTLIDGYR